MKLKLLSFFLLVSVSLAAQVVNIIPKPLETTIGKGSYTLKNKITLANYFSDKADNALTVYLKNYLKKYYNVNVQLIPKTENADIVLFPIRMPTGGTLAYKFSVTEKGIRINANFEESAFHGIQTLIQLLPLNTIGEKQIPIVEIYDFPRFNYRGMHLDVGRHFFPIAYIKQYIDFLAYHKLNVFHWHLTEDQGWRIEIKKYPLLTSIGSKRNGTIIGRYPGKGNDEIPYDGFYTQAEIKEVVQYANERFIEVIPEIEMPGHSSAAIAAYPWLSCFPQKPTEIPVMMISKKSVEEQKKGRIKLVQETWGVFDDVFCAGNDSTFSFLQNVVDEVIQLFPSKYFHIGGDECPKTHWKICSKCQQRMKELGLKDEHELQSYFVQRIEKYLNSKGKTLIGWDEILEGGLAPNAQVMSWRGEAGGIEAAKQKHFVIMTPGKPVYFDHSQSKNEDSVTIGGYNSVEAVYAYNPVPKELNEEESKYVLGAQANVWTEYMSNTKKIEYMIFPRMAALSEVLWSKKENKSWDDFEKRLLVQMKRYEMMNWNYSKAYFDLNSRILPTENNSGVLWEITSKKDGDFNLAKWAHSKNEFEIIEKASKSIILRINQSQNYHVEQTGSGFISFADQIFTFSKSAGKKISLTNTPSNSYPGDGAFTLVNGIINEKGLARSTEFLGFSGTDCEAVIDLGEKNTISNVSAHVLSQPSSWIWPPSSITVQISNDGINYTSVSASTPSMSDNKLQLSFTTVTARYVKVFLMNKGIIPDGNAGSGNKAWLFVSEIQIQ
jgi:hexosaminidase